MKTTIDKAPKCLNINDKAMWVTGWNEAVDAFKREETYERNFCSRCGKRLLGPLGPVSIHTCCPPNARTFDDYGNKIV
jgi:hypothetical protein